ncbi:MAG: diguanylate cyclase with sensor [Paucimonas sp.]|nr:diguanylate cyclase with sensor [Paucimonas sp.]
MKAAAPLPKERARDLAVKSLRLLDTAPEERFDRITRLAQRMFDVPVATISLLDEEREWHKSQVGLPGTDVARELSFLAHALHADDVTTIEDTAADERFFDNPQVTDGPRVRFYAACPLRAKNGVKVGALTLMGHTPRGFDADDCALLRDLAQLAEHELAGTRLGNMDPMTLLSNRSGFEELCQHALNICRRFNKPATLLYFNIDGMGAINERFGRPEGDLALKNLGRIMIQTFRASDVVGRMDDDEFVVLMTDTYEDDAQRALARLTAAVVEYNQTARRGYTLSYSVGSLLYRADVHPSITGLLGAADMAMYEAKRRKRKLAQAQ